MRPLLLALLSVPTLLYAQATKPAELKWDKMDLGPFQSGTFKIEKQITAKGIAIPVGPDEAPATVLFDTELLRLSAAWTGGFIKFPKGRGGLEGQIAPAGEVAFATSYIPGLARQQSGEEDPRDRHLGPLPQGGARWKGLRTTAAGVLLRYQLGSLTIEERPGFQKVGEAGLFTRTFYVPVAEGTTEKLSLFLGELPNSTGTVQDDQVLLEETAQAHALLFLGSNLPADARFRVTEKGRVMLDWAPSSKPVAFQVGIVTGPKGQMPAAEAVRDEMRIPAAILLGGYPSRWGAPVVTQGQLGPDDVAYTADEIPLPEETTYQSWIRPGGHDFLADGRCVLASLSGDVFLVGGLEGDLKKVNWKRYATGLFQPLGVKVLKGEIYILGRDQITKLRDLNGDGEADDYECFNNDCIITENYHEFALDLQTDSQGNFYFAKASPWQPNVSNAHQGTLLKVSPDGASLEVVATGFRAPNGLNIGPDDTITVSDNQGHWMPENRLNIVKPGGFYGMVPAAHKALTFPSKDGDYTADPSDPKEQSAHKQSFWGSTQTPTPREWFDGPLCWLPKPIDNSSGGQVWVPKGDKWGPLGGHLLQMTYGKCALFDVLTETVAGVPQAGLARFPLKFSSGIMRGRFHPLDGQLYLSGLRVWQTEGAKDGCLYRLRYTGQPYREPIALHSTAQGLELTFDTPLDPATASDVENYSVQEWNYLWSGAYGSPDYSVRDPQKKGRDTLAVQAAQLSGGGKTLNLKLEDFRPAMQVLVKYKIKSQDGVDLERELYATIHRLAP